MYLFCKYLHYKRHIINYYLIKKCVNKHVMFISHIIFYKPFEMSSLCYGMVMCILLIPLNLAFPCLQWAFVNDLIS